MKAKFIVLVLVALIVQAGQVMGHALWIETAIKGKKGQKQEVKIYYGEYAEGEIEAIEDWYSDVKDFQLWLIGPDGKKIALETQAASDHFTARFTPEADGVYCLQVGHSAKDLGGDYVYQFNTAAQVWVGKAGAVDLESTQTDLTLLLTSPAKNGLKETLSFKTYFKGTVKSGVTVSVASPEGWSKNYESNEKGEVSIETPWKGQYLIEATHTEETSGEHHGAPYKFIWRGATQSIVR